MATIKIREIGASGEVWVNGYYLLTEEVGRAKVIAERLREALREEESKNEESKKVEGKKKVSKKKV